MERIVSCHNCGQVIGDDEERAWTLTTPRHMIHARCAKKLTKHERDLISDNWHTRTIAQFQDKTVEELKAILADAREAAVAARGMPNEGRYLDEIHYAVGELRRREKKPAPLVNFPFEEAVQEIGPRPSTLTEDNARDGLVVIHKIHRDWGEWILGHDRNGLTIRGDRGSRMILASDLKLGEWEIVRDAAAASPRHQGLRKTYKEQRRPARLSR